MRSGPRAVRSSPFMRSLYAERLATFLRTAPAKPPVPSFMSGDHAGLLAAAIEKKRVLSRGEEDLLISSLRGDNVALFRLALYFLEQQKYGDVLSLIDRIQVFEYAQQLRAAVAVDRRQLDDAVRELEIAVEKNGRVHKAWHALGLARAALGKQSAAIFALYKALRLTPSYGGVL